MMNLQDARAQAFALWISSLPMKKHYGNFVFV